METVDDELRDDLVATGHETVRELVGTIREGTPIRIDFAQRRVDGDRLPGPLADFVVNGDHRALLLYLLAMSRATRSEPWNVILPAAVWARALGLTLPTSKSAASSISKAWQRLEHRGLIARTRSGRMAEVTLRREDGTGAPYTRPKSGFFKLPSAFWLEGPARGALNWYEVLDLPAVTMLLVASSLQPRFRLPVERAPEWYGFSADTAHRGISTLARFGILDVRKRYRKAPLAPQGYTFENQYTLMAPFMHRRGASNPTRDRAIS